MTMEKMRRLRQEGCAEAELRKQTPNRCAFKKYLEISPIPCCASFSKSICAEMRRFTVTSVCRRKVFHYRAVVGEFWALVPCALCVLRYTACPQASITHYMPNQPSEEAGPSRRAGRKLLSIPEASAAVEEGPKRGRARQTVAAKSDAGHAPESSRRGGKSARKGKQAAAAAQEEAATDGEAPSASATPNEVHQAPANAVVSISFLCYSSCACKAILLGRSLPSFLQAGTCHLLGALVVGCTAKHTGVEQSLTCMRRARRCLFRSWRCASTVRCRTCSCWA